MEDFQLPESAVISDISLRKVGPHQKKEVDFHVQEILGLRPSLLRKILFTDPGAITLFQNEKGWVLRFPYQGSFVSVALKNFEVEETPFYRALEAGVLPAEGDQYQDVDVDRFFAWLGERDSPSGEWKLFSCPTVERWKRLSTGGSA